MMIFSHVRIASDSLRANRVRTALTTLGIVIGIASISLVMALGEGARQAVSKQIGKLDGNIIVIKPGQKGFRDISAYNPYNTAITSTLTERDYQSALDAPGVAAVAPIMFISGSVKNGPTEAEGAPIIATSSELAEILKLHLVAGDFIGEATDRDTVAIGQQLAIELFGTDQALGRQLTVKGRSHTVIGIVKNNKQPINLSGVDLDHAVYTSLDDGKSFNQGIAQIQQIAVSARTASQVAPVSAALEKIILANHDGEHDFAVLAADSISTSADDFFGSILIITVIVASISIVVGGIGIMNILLVSVTERTREIGIRKAVGATDGQIMWQFLIESIAMSLTGGVIGLIVAYALAYIIGSSLFFSPAVNWEIIVGSLAIALFVGVIFGIYPAIKAARKDPIEALRQYQ